MTHPADPARRRFCAALLAAGGLAPLIASDARAQGTDAERRQMEKDAEDRRERRDERRDAIRKERRQRAEDRYLRQEQRRRDAIENRIPPPNRPDDPYPRR